MTISLTTIGALLDNDMRLEVYCQARGCGHHGAADLERLAGKLGREHSCLSPDIKQHFICSACGSREISFILSARFGHGGLYGHSPIPSTTERPATTHRRRRRKR